MTRTKTRALANWPNNAVSVLDFGAVGDGVTDDTAAIQAAFDAVLASATGGDGYTQSAPNLGLYFPQGTFYSAGGVTLTVPDNYFGISIFGNGYSSKLVNCSFTIKSTSGSIKNLQIEGGGIIRESTTSRRFWTFSDLLIYKSPENAILIRGEDAIAPGPTYDTFSYIIIQDPGHNGVVVEKTNGNNFDSVTVKNAQRNGFLIDRPDGEAVPGGESKFVNCLAMTNGLANDNSDTGTPYANWMLGGSAGAVVENYYTQCTGTDSRSYRYATVTGVADNGDGTITITFTGDNVRPRANQKIYTGTINGSLSLNNLVIDSCTDTTITVTAASPGPFTSGSFKLPGWDLIIDSPGDFTVNDQYFIGGNFNHVFCKGGYNIQFTGTRIKQQLELTSTVYQFSWMSSAVGREFSGSRREMFTYPTGDAGVNMSGNVTTPDGIELFNTLGTVGSNRLLDLLTVNPNGGSVKAHAKVSFTNNDVTLPVLDYSYNIARASNDGNDKIVLDFIKDAPPSAMRQISITPTSSSQTEINANLLESSRTKIANTDGKGFFVQVFW